MKPSDVAYLPELPAHDPEIEEINAEAFGPGRFTRAAYRIREGGPHDRALSFVAQYDGKVIASVRMTWIAAGEGRALLLGPLAVRPPYKNLGIGKRLVAIAVDAARLAGCGCVILVGDGPYYGPLGFVRVPPGQMEMPRPVDPMRLLAAELVPGSVARMTGLVTHADQVPHVRIDGGSAPLAVPHGAEGKQQQGKAEESAK
ncbi:MAG: N-acetyltransferase [Brucellaceae bacterium]|nr:N-acetyltransferase [Brucellaceae bacterium]MCO5059915.1 N-acetyltransferase [Rhizobiaceae bacterium]